MGAMDAEDNFEHNSDVSPHGGGNRRSHGFSAEGWERFIYNGPNAQRI